MRLVLILPLLLLLLLLPPPPPPPPPFLYYYYYYPAFSADHSGFGRVPGRSRKELTGIAGARFIFQVGCSSWHTTNSVKACTDGINVLILVLLFFNFFLYCVFSTFVFVAIAAKN